MPHAAKQCEPVAVVLDHARVRAVLKDNCVLDTSQGPVRAARAAGCLLAPRPGDLVLACLDPAGEHFVLTVLRRAPDTPGEIAYSGDLRLRASGDLTLAAGNDAALVAGGDLHVAATRGELAFGRIGLLAKAATVRLGALTFVAEAVEQIISRLTQRLTDAVRLVSGHDESQAGSARYLVEDTLTMHAKNAVHMAEEVVKIDAGQVHLG